MSERKRMRIAIGLRLAAAGVLFVLFCTAHPASGQTTPLIPPTSLRVIELDAWNNVVAEGDQFYVVVYEIAYSDADARPEANAAETMILRLAGTGGVSYRMAVPAPFVNRGYARGIGGMYFSPIASNAPPWSSAEVYAQVIGNPIVAWNGGQPVSNQRLATYHASRGASDEDRDAQQEAVAEYLRTQVPVLELNWLTITQTVTDLIAGEPTVLTASGEEYFLQASPQQRLVSPSLYSFNITNPDLVSFGKGRLTADASTSESTIHVSDVASAGFQVGQDIMLIGASVNETVRIAAVSGNALNVEPSLTHAYQAGSEVWVVAQSTQTDIEKRVQGSFFESMLNTGADALGLSPVMFGILASMVAGAGGGVVVGGALSAVTQYAFYVGTVAAILVLMFMAFISFLPVAALGIIATVVLLLAFWIHFFR